MKIVTLRDMLRRQDGGGTVLRNERKYLSPEALKMGDPGGQRRGELFFFYPSTCAVRIQNCCRSWVKWA